MTEPVVLAIDLGTSSVKAALVTFEGRVRAWEKEPLRTIVTPDGGAEQSPDAWWAALVSATRRLRGNAATARSTIRAVCCSTQGEGTVPVDAHGRALMNCITWMDMRGAAQLRRRFCGLVNFDGLSLRKTIRWVRLTGGRPSTTGKDPAAHMLLVRERFPEVYARTHKFLNVLDYLNLRLTGRCVATFDSILTSWVTDNRDVSAIRYHPALVRDSGIEAQKLPEIVPCTTVLGNVTAEAAEALGLDADVKVVAGSIDNTAAAIGAGAVEDLAAHLYVGTSSWLAAHVPWKKTDPFHSLASVPCAVPGRYLLMALQATAGGNVRFLCDTLLFPREEARDARNDETVFQAFDTLAERAPAGSNGVLYAPWLWGERAPVEDHTLRAGLYNLSLHTTRADIARAALEGVALNMRWLRAPVEKFLGRALRSVAMVGGGAQSDLWCRIFADVMGVEVRQVEDPAQANVRGAAWIAAAGLGALEFKDIPALVRYTRTYTPDPAQRALYDERFEVFKRLHGCMRGIHRRLNG